MYNSDSGLKSGKAATENNDVIRFLEFNNEIADINSKISTLNGAYYVLDSYNFGKTLNENDPEDILILNTYAIANTPGASSMDDVYNDTVIINEFDSAEYVYNKISELWVKYPNGYLTIATNEHLGVVKGTQPPADPDDESKDTYVQVLADGAMKLVGDRLGKVNTVDGLEPDTNKDIRLTYTYSTETAYEADKNNVPDGARVVIQDKYPDNHIMIERPDYALQETINRISVNNGTWTVDRTGFIYFNIRAFTFLSSESLVFYVNNKPVDSGQCNQNVSSGSPFLNRISGVVPVTVGDVVRVYVSATATFNNSEVYFIPPKYEAQLQPKIVAGIDSDYSLTEQPVMKWDPFTATVNQKKDCDGRPIWERTFTGNIVAAANTGVMTTLIASGVHTYLDYFGSWRQGSDARYRPFVYTGTATLEVKAYPSIDAGHLFIYSISGSGRSGTTNNDYRITIRYTKE
jgi:hypothetical protein